MEGKGRGSRRKGDEAEGIWFLCVGLYGHGVELLGCCLCTAKALAWAVCVALPTVPIPSALNGFHYSRLECRRRFFQTVIYVFKQSEQTEELDAGHPPKSQLTPRNSRPSWEAGGGRKIPSVILISLDYSMLEKPRLLYTTLSYCPSPPGRSWSCCFAAHAALPLCLRYSLQPVPSSAAWLDFPGM